LDVANLVIDTPAGGHVRLGAVADVRVQPEPTVIRHDNISRSLDVTAGVSGRGVDSVIADVKNRLASMPMPLEFHAEVLSGSTAYDAEHLRLAITVLAIVIAILLLLQLALGSWRSAGLTLISIPLGAAGAVITAAFTGGGHSLGALLGVLAVLGVVIRNNVLLVRSYQDVPAHDEQALMAGVLAATREHLMTVVLTALLIAAAMLPFALGGVVAGTEVLQPLAVVCLAGLVTATFVSLFLLPALYPRLARRPRRSDPMPAPTPGPGVSDHDW
jgi:Cu/Ag efflux pump CusA